MPLIADKRDACVRVFQKNPRYSGGFDEITRRVIVIPAHDGHRMIALRSGGIIIIGIFIRRYLSDVGITPEYGTANPAILSLPDKKR
jgi:hypothetical protein